MGGISNCFRNRNSVSKNKEENETDFIQSQLPEDSIKKQNKQSSNLAIVSIIKQPRTKFQQNSQFKKTNSIIRLDQKFEVQEPVKVKPSEDNYRNKRSPMIPKIQISTRKT